MNPVPGRAGLDISPAIAVAGSWLFNWPEKAAGKPSPAPIPASFQASAQAPAPASFPAPAQASIHLSFHPAGAFTLVELLIVVAIIGILAAIATPNFLEAQVRAKATRCVGDLRSVATALEAYAVDYNRYPPNTRSNNYSIPPMLTTPVAFIASALLRDPFASVRAVEPGTYGSMPNVGLDPEDIQLYSYQTVMTLAQARVCPRELEPPADAIDSPGYNPGAAQRYGSWKLISFGPDGYYTDPSKTPVVNLIQQTFDILYDPTNGSLSFGNLYRTHRSPTGAGTRK